MKSVNRITRIMKLKIVVAPFKMCIDASHWWRLAACATGANTASGKGINAFMPMMKTAIVMLSIQILWMSEAECSTILLAKGCLLRSASFS